MTGLVTSLISGISFVIGFIITKLIKQKEKFVIFAISLSFPIMLSLIFLDLLPECIESLSSFGSFKRTLVILILTLIGITFLKLLDLFIPHHSHNHHTKNPKEHTSHLFHIGLVTTIALFLHNLIEGVAIYTTTINDLKAGLLMMGAVSLHNIPLSIEISSSTRNNKKKSLLMIFLLTISAFLGCLIIYLSHITIPPVVLGSLIALTIGMLIYISILELFPEILNHFNLKETKYGLISGIIIIIVMIFI